MYERYCKSPTHENTFDDFFSEMLIENNPLKTCMFSGKQRDWLYPAISRVIFILKIPKFSPKLFVNILSRFFLIWLLSAWFKRCIQYNNALQFLNVTWLQCIKVKRSRSFRWISKVPYYVIALYFILIHNCVLKLSNKRFFLISLGLVFQNFY